MAKNGRGYLEDPRPIKNLLEAEKRPMSESLQLSWKNPQESVQQRKGEATLMNKRRLEINVE